MSLADSSPRLDFSCASLKHRKVQLGSSITPSYDPNSEASTLLTNIFFLCWVDVIRQEEQEYWTTASNPTGSSVHLRKRVLGQGMRK